MRRVSGHSKWQDIEHKATPAQRATAEANLAIAQAAATVTCSGCGREVAEDEAQAARWGYWSVGVGRLHPFCPDCARREFGSRPS